MNKMSLKASMYSGLFSGLFASAASTYFLRGNMPSVGGIPLWAYSFLMVGGASIILSMVSDKILPMFKNASVNLLTYVISPGLMGLILALSVYAVTYMATGTMMSFKSIAVVVVIGALAKLVGDYVFRMIHMYMYSK